MAALSLATDLGLGQPLEHELGVCLSALELADRLGCGEEECSDVYYVALLAHVGCTAAAPHFASWVGGDEIHFQRGAQVLGPASEPSEDVRYLVRRFADDRPLPERARLVAKMLVGGQKRFELAAANLCEGGRLLARRLHLPDEVALALGQVTERWDGKGVPGAAAGEEISRPLRIVRVAHDFVAIAQARDRAAAIEALRRRRGRGYDPAVVDAALADPERAAARGGRSRRVGAGHRGRAAAGRDDLDGRGLASVARAFGEFADLKLGFLRGHSARVAELAAAAAAALGCSRAEISEVRSRGLSARLRQGGGAERDLGQARPAERRASGSGSACIPTTPSASSSARGALAPFALLAGSHHERLDGSGYHRGARAAQLSVGARLLAAADAYDAMTHDRPHRRALRPEAARDGARRDGPRRGAREAHRRRRARGGGRRAAASPPGPPGRAQRARGRGAAPARAGAHEQGDRPTRS